MKSASGTNTIALKNLGRSKIHPAIEAILHFIKARPLPRFTTSASNPFKKSLHHFTSTPFRHPSQHLPGLTWLPGSDYALLLQLIHKLRRAGISDAQSPLQE